MKSKILIFIIGILMGSIISTIGFYLYEKSSKADTQNNFGDMQMPMQGGEKPDFNFEEKEIGTKPEVPTGEQNNMFEDREKEDNQILQERNNP